MPEIKSEFVEPADLEFIRTGAKWPYTFWQRDERAGKDADGWSEPGASWWDCLREDGGDGPQTWEHVSSLPDPLVVTFAALDSFSATDGSSVSTAKAVDL